MFCLTTAAKDGLALKHITPHLSWEFYIWILLQIKSFSNDTMCCFFQFYVTEQLWVVALNKKNNNNSL